MSGDQVRFDAPLPDLWDDEHAASLDDPGLLLYRSNLLGSDLRITNFGGGNTSAKLTATDPLTGAPTASSLGQGFRRRHRLDEARRLLDALSRQAPQPQVDLSRPRARGRDGRALQSLHLQPQSARNLDRHNAARLRSAHAMSITFTRTRSLRSRRAKTPKRSRKRSMAASLAFCRGSGRASTLGSSSARWLKPIRT